MESSLLFALISVILSIVVVADDSPGFLSTFVARSLVKVSYERRAADTIGQFGLIEVEETYDGERKLGKVVVYATNGNRVELYARPSEHLYLDAQFNVAGTLVGCRVGQKKSSFGGYFQLFHELATQPAGDGGHSQKESSEDHLIGPSALVYRFRNELTAEWSAKTRAQMDKQQNGSTGMRKDLDYRRRLIVDPTPVEFTLGSLSKLEARKVIFKRSDFLIERSPLLSELASFVSYVDSTGRQFTIDLLSLKEIDLTPAMSSWDPFRIPTGFGCGLDVDKELLGTAHSIDERWSKQLPIRSNLMSAILYGASLPSIGVHLAVDLRNDLMLIKIPDTSISVVDTKRAIVYHMPNEKASGSLQDPSEININNGECSIISSVQLISKESTSTASSLPLDRWHSLVGDTNHMMYLGQTMYQQRRLAHEFELYYRSAHQLPDYFRLLIDRCVHHDWTNSSRQFHVLAKLWLAVDNSTACANMYSMGSTCEMPTVLGFRVELTSGIGSVACSEEIQLAEFQWSLEEDGIAERPFETFDLTRCPLNKLLLSLDIKWTDNEPLVDHDETDATPEPLDDLVPRQLTDYLYSQPSSKNLHIVSLQRQTSVRGIRVARYYLELAQFPKESIDFVSQGTSIRRDFVIGAPLDQLSGGGSLFECLGWASQFSQSKAVLYSQNDNQCFIYSNYQLVNQSSGEETGNEYCLLFDRIIKNNSASNPTDALNLFLSKDLDLIDSEIREDSKKPNGVQASMDGTTLVRDIRFISLKVASRNSGQNQAATLKTKTGYRFANLDQSECNSLVQCQRWCDEQPNCNAFAHCRYPDSVQEFCQLNITSDEGTDKHIDRGELTRDAGCEIHTKNYLHYFEPLNLNTKSWDLHTMNTWHPVPDALDQLNCARACHSLQDNSCLRFVFCPAPEVSPPKCLVWHEDMSLSEEFLKDSEMAPAITKTPSQSGCLGFKRKPITLYQRTLDSKTSGLDWQGDSLRQTVLHNIDREKCAERCIQEMECQSFDTCLVKTSSPPSMKLSRTFTSLECVLLSGSIYDTNPRQMYLNQAQPQPSGESQLQMIEDSRRCSHYESFVARRRLSFQEDERLIETLARGSTNENVALRSQTSYAGSLFGAALLGLTLGVVANGLATLWRSTQRRWYGL